MAQNHVERRACVRFVIPGAVVYYRKEGLFASRRFTEDFYPVIDISRGGLRMVCQAGLEMDTRLVMKIEIPGEEPPLEVAGRVCWSAPNPGKSYRYQVGVRFEAYGRQKEENAPEVLERLIALEERFRG